LQSKIEIQKFVTLLHRDIIDRFQRLLMNDKLPSVHVAFFSRASQCVSASCWPTLLWLGDDVSATPGQLRQFFGCLA
jgi:hypothetical protein